jgi:hypothetical protein
MIPTHYRRYMRVYLLKENTILKQISSLNDLQGFVQIDSAEKAIEFVWFRTSGRTYYLFRPNTMIEVFQRPTRELEEGLYYGECSPEFFEQHHLNNLEVVEKEGYFEIRRYLLAFPWEGEGVEVPTLYQTIEKVYEDGNYIIEKKKVFEGFVYHDISYPGIPM